MAQEDARKLRVHTPLRLSALTWSVQICLAQIAGCSLLGANLSGADLQGAQLVGVDLRLTNLREHASWARGWRWSPRSGPTCARLKQRVRMHHVKLAEADLVPQTWARNAQQLHACRSRARRL
jgi:uncharacterized protein YjbI with pentapeptide repeats